MIETVGVVVVNHNGGELTLACLRSVLNAHWPRGRLRVVLVDNDSSDGITAQVRHELPAVTIIELSTNQGFGAACNVAIAALAGVDAFALINNDATVDRAWLEPLADALDADPMIGAACPKILLDGQFRRVVIRSTTSSTPGDRRERGALVAGARVDGGDVWSATRLSSGFWGAEGDAEDPRAQWSRGTAELLLPAGRASSREQAELLLSAADPTSVELVVGARSTVHEVQPRAAWWPLVLDGDAVDIVNNAGTVLDADGYGADRGYLDVDDGGYDTPMDVFAWCGGAVLLRREYLDDVGSFDERLFVYYEDVDLAWRGAKRGWRYRYVPRSVVRHHHGATSGTGSAFKQWHDDRNHLLVMARHASPAATVRSASRFLAATGSYARRDLVRPALSGRTPTSRIVRARLSAFGSFLRLLPGTIRSRTGTPSRIR